MGLILLPLLKGLAWFFFLLPAGLRLACGRAMGAALFKFRFRGKVIDQNLALAYPKDSAMRARIFRAACDHLGHLVVEILFLLGPMKRYILGQVELEGLEHWKSARDRGRGVIVLAGHVGNWEIMAAAGSLLGKMDPLIVTKHLKPEWLHRAIERGRARCGVTGTYEPGTMKDVLRKLRSGGTVGIILDQYAGPPIGVRVPVFGVPVGTNSALAALAKRTGAAVVPMVSCRDAAGKFRVKIRPALPWVEDEDAGVELAKNTAAFAAVLEKDIFSYPEQWLWTHRRFKGDLSPLRIDEWKEARVRH